MDTFSPVYRDGSFSTVVEPSGTANKKKYHVTFTSKYACFGGPTPGGGGGGGRERDRLVPRFRPVDLVSPRQD